MIGLQVSVKVVGVLGALISIATITLPFISMKLLLERTNTT